MFTSLHRNPLNLPGILESSTQSSNLHGFHIKSAQNYLLEIWNVILSYGIIMETHQNDFLVIFDVFDP